ncbi:CRISPR-associated endoribonuclease Cas6 [Alteribacillus iranensis]|uniref:CRISPR-associated endoribonuclease Cas6 n=1 Tax=Alteribacillus iranensis TaxID=930128 RepID=A0A1I2BAW6_9BACI|nr:CRISPR-associated endoribonuclease Cas6 [Alteribacillus iranensis]SFE52443.1 CRISPR-associated endoribonuclease Cas6 [Alteribacillus iranensis]
MKLRVTFTIPDGYLDYGFQMGVVSLIKEALRRSDNTYFNKLYGKDNVTKPFCFATFFHEPTFKKDKIFLKQLSITVSSLDHEFLLHFHNGLIQIVEFQYKEVCWIKENVQLLKEKNISSPSVIFKTLSPLLIEDKKGNPLSPEHTSYEEELNYYADVLAQEFHHRSLYRSIVVKNHNMKKTVIKSTNREWEKNKKGFLYFTAYRGLIELDGHPEDLKLMYRVGLGRRRTQNFGLLDVYRQT